MVTVRYKVLSSGKFSTYPDIYSNTGEGKGKRNYEFLKIYVDKDYPSFTVRQFNLANLSVTSVEVGSTIVYSLATLKLQKACAAIINLVGGSDESSIIQNIYNRLAELNPSASAGDLQNTATAIYKSGYLYSFPASLIATIIQLIKKAISSKGANFLLISTDYTDDFLNEFITLGDQLNLDQRTIEDLVVFANRKEDKYVDPQELELRAKFFAKQILTRKFPAGFTNETSYQTF